MNKSRVIRWCVTALIFFWGFFSFLVIAGDENPEAPMPLREFILIKVASAVSMLLCCKVGGWLYKRGYIIEFDHAEEDDYYGE